jgi:asparagine synthetase B (glutamine-hydrolysing)
MLNGQGSDEILLGYERYFTSTLNFNKPLVNWKRLLIKIRIHVCLTKYSLAITFILGVSLLEKWGLKIRVYLKEFKKKQIF